MKLRTAATLEKWVEDNCLMVLLNHSESARYCLTLVS